jgi:Zn-dependent metalloprotease
MNAFWDGQQMVYGDGDGEIFERFTKSLDIIGHELAHGVTQYEAGLIYEDEPGALNEHFSDVFGVLVKQYSRKQRADKADWLIGKGLFSRGVNGVALRSMKAPGTAFDDPLIGKDVTTLSRRAARDEGTGRTGAAFRSAH